VAWVAAGVHAEREARREPFGGSGREDYTTLMRQQTAQEAV